MVKDSKTARPMRFPPPPVKRKPGVTKDGRLMARVHPDLEEIVKNRAALDTGDNISRFLQRLILAYVQADPRNPRVDLLGVRVPNAISPQELKAREPFKFAERWQQFVTLHTILFGNPPPPRWLEEFTAGSPSAGDFVDEQDPLPPEAQKWVEKSKAKKR